MTDAVHQSLLKALFYVVISTGPDRGGEGLPRGRLEGPTVG